MARHPTHQRLATVTLVARRWLIYYGQYNQILHTPACSCCDTSCSQVAIYFGGATMHYTHQRVAAVTSVDCRWLFTLRYDQTPHTSACSFCDTSCLQVAAFFGSMLRHYTHQQRTSKSSHVVTFEVFLTLALYWRKPEMVPNSLKEKRRERVREVCLFVPRSDLPDIHVIALCWRKAEVVPISPKVQRVHRMFDASWSVPPTILSDILAVMLGARDRKWCRLLARRSLLLSTNMTESKSFRSSSWRMHSRSPTFSEHW